MIFLTVLRSATNIEISQGEIWLSCVLIKKKKKPLKPKTQKQQQSRCTSSHGSNGGLSESAWSTKVLMSETTILVNHLLSCLGVRVGSFHH